MALDVIKPKGPTKRNSPTAGGANPRMFPVLGTVKDNVDPQRMGFIQVYLADNSGLDPEDSTNWRKVRFLSPFYGLTRPDAPNEGYGTFKGNPSSYGMWMAPPDIGTQVLCLFVDGDLNYGFYIGCVPEPEAMQMIPAIGATDNIVPNEGEAKSFGGAKKLPVTNINTNNKNTADSIDYLNAAKPVHSYSAAIMFQQGILRDSIRGPISSSSQRETPSRVGWGVSTPGRPIYAGGFNDTNIVDNLTGDKTNDLRVVSRRGGHTIVMDDGDIVGRDQLIRIRTALGHQITMSDDGQTLMILHSNGQSYVELGKEGTVDVYSTNSINLRTQGDLNLHADNNINIHAGKNLNIHSGENTHMVSEKETKQRVGTNHSISAGGKFGYKATGTTAITSGGAVGITSSAAVSIKGSKVNLNSGAGPSASEVSAIDKVLHTDTLFDSEKGYMAAPAKLTSITSRAPAHTPWSNAGQGVDVKVDLNASSQLPAAPSASVAATNATAAAASPAAVPTGVVASAPSIGGNVSGALNDKTGQALAATMAADAKTGPFSAATEKGAAIATTAAGVQAAAGAAIPMTAEQMQQSGVIKPGSATLVNSLAASTGNATTAFPSTVFTSGNLTTFTTSAQAQTAAVGSGLQAAQTGLQNAGVMTGGETATQVAGLTLSAAKNGVAATAGAVAISSSGLPSVPSAPGVPTVPTSAALKDIGKGNLAAGISTGAKSALSGLKDSVGALKDKAAAAVESAKGAAAGAFAAIKNSFKPMKAGVPQNLTEIAKQGAEKTASAGMGGNNLGDMKLDVPKLPTVSMPAGGIGAVAGKITGSAASSIASGISALPGGASAVSSVTNLANSSVPSLPGTDNLKSAMAGKTTGLLNNIGNTISGGATKLLDSLKSTDLKSALTAALPPAAAAALSSATSSIAAPGTGVKTPSVAANTTNRASSEAATASQLGDPKIPAPNFSTDSGAQEASAGTLTAAQQEKKGAFDAALGEFNAATKELKQKVADLNTIKGMGYGSSDPEYIVAKSEATAAKKKALAAQAKAAALYEDVYGVKPELA